MYQSIFARLIYFLGLSSSLLLLSSCVPGNIREINAYGNEVFQSSVSFREPSLGTGWLVSLVNKRGKENIELINLRTRQKVPLPGINRADSQPISVSINSDGTKLSFIRQRDDQIEVLVYRRNLNTLQRIELPLRGIPRRVSISGSGRLLAVQVSRKGHWEIDIIRLP